VLKIITANLNGIRSAASKGFFEWVAAERAAAVGVQEVKAQHDQVHGQLDRVGRLAGHFHYALKKGYSGVGLFLRETPSDLIRGLGAAEFDAEGRWIEARYDRPGRRLSLISCYVPSGSSGEDRQAAKYRFLDVLGPKLRELEGSREFIFMGDVNIAHREADLKNWKSNQKNSGFLPEERAWMTQLLEGGQLVDVYRKLHPQATEACYTWWSNRGEAWAKNVGWRLDYHLATRALAGGARRATIYKAQRFSDHAPLAIEYDATL
jgi:exodeoxyribonuclease-3